MKPRKKKSSRHSKSRRSDHSCRIAGYQLLEDRRMLATFSVTNAGPSGPGSLVQALVDSNNTPGADAIDISSSVRVIVLTDGLSVTDSVTIEGNGIIITPAHDFRIFDVSSGATQFNLNDVILLGGGIEDQDGGAIRATSASTSISIIDSVLANNEGQRGGAIFAEGSVTIENSRISDNRASRSGGGISTRGALTINDSVVTRNVINEVDSGGVFGGGIASEGVLTINNSTIFGNSIRDDEALGGGIFANVVMLNNSVVSGNTATTELGSNAHGGGIYSTGSVELSNSVVTLNEASDDGGGIFSEDGVVTLTNNSTVTRNTSGANGGGIYSEDGGVVLINSSVLSNIASGGAGGIGAGFASPVTLTDSSVSMNSAEFLGGGIATGGLTTLIDSSVSGNSGLSGGGIFTNSGVSLTNSTVTGNETFGTGTQSSGGPSFFGRGGGIYSDGGPVTLVNSTVSQNSTIGGLADGGGIFSGGINEQGGEVTLTNSTVSGNSTAGLFAQGGGVYAGGEVVATNSTISGNSTAGASALGGGIFAIATTVTLNNSTVYGNSSGEAGGGVGFNDAFTGQALTINNSIIAGNSDIGGSAPDFVAPASLTVQNSIIGAVPVGLTLSGGGNQSGTIASPLDPLLGPLADNGGPTETHALLAGSPAINTGDNSLAVDPDGNALQTDQRDFNRITSGTVDIGAFEFGSQFLLGDVDQNGIVNFLDIAPFIGVLSAGGFQAEADINQDGIVNFLDIAPFIGVLNSPASSMFFAAAFAPPKPSQLTFVDSDPLQNEDEPDSLKNVIPESNSAPAVLQLSNEKTASQPSLLETTPEADDLATTADLFDTQPELLNKLFDVEQDLNN